MFLYPAAGLITVQSPIISGNGHTKKLQDYLHPATKAIVRAFSASLDDRGGAEIGSESGFLQEITINLYR